jgi:hypothetical protein
MITEVKPPVSDFTPLVMQTGLSTAPGMTILVTQALRQASYFRTTLRSASRTSGNTASAASFLMRSASSR